MGSRAEVLEVRKRRVEANFQFLSGGLNRSVPVGRAAHDDIRGDISVPRSYVNGTSWVQASVGT